MCNCFFVVSNLVCPPVPKLKHFTTGIWSGCQNIRHNHYYYTTLFNDVSVVKQVMDCSLEKQRLSYNEQNKKKTLPDKYKFLLHVSKEFCLYATIIKDIKKSSDATSQREFIPHKYALQELLEMRSARPYLKEIDQIFDRHFVSHMTIDNLLGTIADQVAEKMFYQQSKSTDKTS